MVRLVIGFLLLLTCAVPVRAQAGLQRPLDFGQVSFYLHTVDVGLDIAAKYGHTQIRMVDRSLGQDVVFSWGIFDFNAPNFAWNFYRGILIYQIGAFPMQRAMAIYQHDQRPVWEDYINLTEQQKIRLFEKIVHDLLPENRHYPYQYFFDNCSTRPRDFIDHALGGAFQRHMTERFSEDSFRTMVRVHQATTPLSGMALEILMNSRLDRTMTAWEEMFLPMRLRQRLQELPQFDDDGEPIPHASLLEFRGQLVTGPSYRASYWRDDLIVILGLGLPLMLLVTFRKMGRQVAAQRVLGLALVVWGTLSCLLGLLMVSNWLISDHLDLHHNANLMLFWPLDVVLVISGIKLWRQRPVSFAWYRVTRVLIGAHLAFFALALVMQFTPLLQQDMVRVLGGFAALGAVYMIMGLRALSHLVIHPR